MAFTPPVALFSWAFSLACDATQVEATLHADARSGTLSVASYETARDCLGPRPELAEHLARRLFASRRFDDLDEIRDWHELFSARIPRVVLDSAGDESGRAVLLPRESDWLVTRVAPPRNGIVVLFHPLCSPSGRALKALEAEVPLGDAFFLAPAAPSFALAPWAQWQTSYPQWRPQIAHRESDWPELADWATPSFIFLRDGKAVHTIVGWPPEGNWSSWRVGVARLQAGSESTDLLDKSKPD